MAAHPDRARAEAGRRARGKVRRFCAAHGLNRLGTLTYAPPFCTDPRQLRRDVAEFFRALRASTGGDPLPYLWVPETHKDGERFHVHFAVGRYIPRSLIERSWGHGFVHIKLLSDLPIGSGEWGATRRVAGYLSKYVAKTFDTDHGGLHRYEVAQGFQPGKEILRGRTADEVIAAAVDRMRSQPLMRWNSDESLDWKAAPAVWLAW